MDQRNRIVQERQNKTPLGQACLERFNQLIHTYAPLGGASCAQMSKRNRADRHFGFIDRLASGPRAASQGLLSNATVDNALQRIFLMRHVQQYRSSHDRDHRWN